MVGPGGQYGIDFFEKCLVFGKLDEHRDDKKLRRFDALRVATGSYTVEKKRIASKKLFRWVPGHQDAKNGSKRNKNVEFFSTGSAACEPLGPINKQT